MRLSPLQNIFKGVLWNTAEDYQEGYFVHFYDEQKLRPKAGDLVNIITKSLECFIVKGCLLVMV